MRTVLPVRNATTIGFVADSRPSLIAPDGLIGVFCVSVEDLQSALDLASVLARRVDVQETELRQGWDGQLTHPPESRVQVEPAGEQSTCVRQDPLCP